MTEALSLGAAPPFASSLGGARGIVFMIGGYDGIGNFGDRMQLEQAARLVLRLGGRIAAVPVIDPDNRDNSRALEFNPLVGWDPHRALFACERGRAPGPPGSAQLRPAELPAGVIWAATYLYGGGYMGRRWGARKLAMVAAVDELCARSGLEASTLVSTGIQIEPGWLEALDPDQARLLGRLTSIGARDPVSAGSTLPAGSGRRQIAAVETADDSIGALAPLIGTLGDPDHDSRRVNLHVSGHDWTAEDAAAPAEYLSGVVDSIAASRSETLELQPLLAFEDSRTSERPALERFIAAANDLSRPLTVAEPIELSPVGIDQQAAQMRRAGLTLSCSYHVALASLMVGVPAALVAGTDHYRHKAEGLRRAFGLPEALILDPATEPGPAAEAIIALLDDQRARESLSSAIADGQQRALRLRAEAERELLGELARSFADALAARIDLLGADPGLAERPATELVARLAAIREDFAAALADAELAREAAATAAERESGAEAERSRAQEALSELERSRSWRLTEPLRAGRARAWPRLAGVLARVRKSSSS